MVIVLTPIAYNKTISTTTPSLQGPNRLPQDGPQFFWRYFTHITEVYLMMIAGEVVAVCWHILMMKLVKLWSLCIERAEV